MKGGQGTTNENDVDLEFRNSEAKDITRVLDLPGSLSNRKVCRKEEDDVTLEEGIIVVNIN